MSDFASTAANLANTNKKSSKTWTPGLSTAAGKAALLATDIEGVQVRRPKSSPASSTAATLAAKGHLGRRTSTEISRKTHLSNQATDRKDREEKALLAATKSFANRRPSESGSSTLARASAQQTALTQLKIAARQQEARNRNERDLYHGNPMPHAPREMFTEHPPVRLEVEEARHNDALHASAVAIAQNAYTVKSQRDIAAADMALQTRSQTAPSKLKQRAMDYLALQDTAQKLATNRLSKINDPDEIADFRSYYGYPEPKNSSTSFLKTIGYRRSNNDETSDRAQSERIRSQMTLLQAQIAQVDTSKRDQDRQHVREAAERIVHDRMHKLDETVFNQTGKMSPAMVDEWDAKARARITEERVTAERERQPKDRVDIGGGMYIDQSEIDAIAEARVRPTLDNIDEAVGRKKAADTEAKLNDEEKKRHVLLEKQRKKDLKGEQKHVKGKF
jgi:Eisosome protein 1